MTAFTPAAYSEQPRPPIALHPVESGQVKAVGYDAATQTLAVQFRHGKQAIYHYRDVSPETHAAFVSAESLGSFFRDNLKSLPFEKYPADPAPEAEQEETA